MKPPQNLCEPGKCAAAACTATSGSCCCLGAQGRVTACPCPLLGNQGPGGDAPGARDLLRPFGMQAAPVNNPKGRSMRLLGLGWGMKVESADPPK